jgi:hypothetical protein
MNKSRAQADISSKGGAQRRRFTRHRADLPLTVTVLRQDGYVRLQGRCHEIAEAGLGGVISTALVAGEVVSLEFSIPDVPQPLILRAVVRHRAGLCTVLNSSGRRLSSAAASWHSPGPCQSSPDGFVANLISLSFSLSSAERTIMHNARCSLGPNRAVTGKKNTELLEEELWPL